MAEAIPESLAAKAALNEQQAPAPLDPVINAPGDGGNDEEHLDPDLGSEGDDMVTEESGGMNYANAAKTTWLLTLNLYREDKSNDFVVSYREVAELVFKRLGVPNERGLLHSVDTSSYKKIELELDNQVKEGNLNITQSLQVRSGLWTRPIQAPEKDRLINIKWAPMKMVNADIEAVLKWFGEITVGVTNNVFLDTGKDDWTSMMIGVKTADRSCKMKVEHNIPSIILIRGTKVRIDYPGQPKTCSRCCKYWSACPGSGKVEKCKKEGGEEKDVKVFFKNLMTRLKRKGGAETESDPVVPEFIPNPDMIRFNGFPEDYKVKDFKEWLNANAVNFLDPMVFKEKKPGVFSIATVETEEGETFKLEADEAADIVTRLNGSQFKRSNKRIMVVMMQLTTPEKKKPDVVTLSSSDDSGDSSLLVNGQLALRSPQAPPAGDGEGGDDDDDGDVHPVTPDMARELLEVDTGEGGAIPKFKLNVMQTAGGSKHYRKVGDKSKREDSDSSVNASPELPKSQPVTKTEKDKAKTTPPWKQTKQNKQKQSKKKPRK